MRIYWRAKRRGLLPRIGRRRVELNYNTGLAYEAFADWPSARASYEEALEVQPDYGAARIRLVEIENNLAQ